MYRQISLRDLQQPLTFASTTVLAIAANLNVVVSQVPPIWIQLMLDVPHPPLSRQSHRKTYDIQLCLCLICHPSDPITLCASLFRSDCCTRISVAIFLSFISHFTRLSNEAKFNQNYFLLKWAFLISLSNGNGACRPCRIV